MAVIRNQIWILCAAVHYIPHVQGSFCNPKNITEGLVISGRRHAECYCILLVIPGVDVNQHVNTTDGFITSDNKFVTREEALLIAKKAGQCKDIEGILISEHLYND